MLTKRHSKTMVSPPLPILYSKPTHHPIVFRQCSILLLFCHFEKQSPLTLSKEAISTTVNMAISSNTPANTFVMATME